MQPNQQRRQQRWQHRLHNLRRRTYRPFNITIIGATAVIGGSIAVTGDIMVHDIAPTIDTTAATGGRHTATVRHQSIAAATLMFAGAIIVIAPIEPTITLSSPITGPGVSAILHICKKKSPGSGPGLVFKKQFRNQVT